MSEIIHLPKRIDLIAMLPGGSTIAEIGVHKGWFSAEMLNLPNLAHLILVDSWKTRPEYNDPLSNDDHEKNLEETKRNLEGHAPGGRFSIMRMDSLDAAYLMASNGKKLDAVFIDADHSFDAVLADLRAWSRVIKIGGSIMGHDYTNNPTSKKYGWGVIEAVQAFGCESDWRISHLTDEDFASFCLRKI